MIDPDSNEARLQRHRDANRFVHPDVSAAWRASAEREQAQREDAIRGASLEITAALGYVDLIATKKDEEITYETMQRSGFRRPDGWRRKYTLADARSHAQTAAIKLRNAWELIEPVNPARQANAQRTALANSQDALQVAISHLQAVLNQARSHAEQQAADTAARQWLESIGSEPK